jgi:hypothetical protein
VEAVTTGTTHVSGFLFPDTPIVVLKNGRRIPALGIARAKLMSATEREEVSRVFGVLESEVEKRRR